MISTGSWTVAQEAARLGAAHGRSVVSHPLGASFTIEHCASRLPATLDSTGLDPGRLPWTLRANNSMIWGHVIGRFPTHEEAVGAIMRGDAGLLVEHALEVAWRYGAFSVGLDLAMEVCPAHGFGLLEHDEAWTWNPQQPSSLGLTDVDEVWVLTIDRAPEYAVLHRPGAGARPWEVLSVSDYEGCWDLVDEGLSFATRHSAVARVESFRDDILEHRQPSAVFAFESCCLCEPD